MVMIMVSTAELKARLGRYLRMVRNGETIHVTSHRHAVARLMPVGSQVQPETVAPTRSMQEMADVGPVPLAKPADGVALLLEDRRSR